MGEMISRKNRALTSEDIEKITTTYHNWKKQDETYADIAGFCKSANMADIEKNDYILTPGRYVWVALSEDTDETFEAKMLQYTTELSEQMQQEKDLDERIKINLESIGYTI